MTAGPGTQAYTLLEGEPHKDKLSIVCRAWGMGQWFRAPAALEKDIGFVSLHQRSACKVSVTPYVLFEPLWASGTQVAHINK